MIKKIIAFIQHDIWRIRTRQISGIRGWALRYLRILILSVREFSSDKCTLRASALTFFSLLSIVPVLAMSFGLAKGFGMDRLLREKLLESMQGQQEVLTRAITFAENLLQNTRGGLIAGIGLLILFWSVIKVLGHIETSFNDIWGFKRGRSWGRKFTDYLALMLIAPIFFISASSATVFVTSQLSALLANLGVAGSLLLFGMKFLPYAVFWGLLTYLYLFMPNGKINFKSAILGGIVAGTLFQLVQWGYIHFQVGVSKANAIYGSFAALPLFLVWLQASWLIVLYGAELAFAHQNDTTFEFENDCLSASYSTKKLMALRITQLCIKRFVAGEPPLSSEEIASQLEMPIRLTREVLFRLTEGNILSLTDGDDVRERCYQPAQDVDKMTIAFVIDHMEKIGTQNIPVVETPELDALRASLAAFEGSLVSLPENRLLKDL